MNDRADPRLVRRCSIFASASALFAVVVGLSGMTGWTLHIAGLYTWSFGPVKMVPNTAAGFILLGVSLWLLRGTDGQPFASARKLSANAAAGIAALLGMLSLAEHLFGWDFGIDQVLLVVPPADQLAGLRPGLMSSITASDFIVLGSALLLLDWKTRRDDWPSQFLCLGALTGAAFGLLALLLEPDASYTSMSLPTVVTFFVLTAGLVCSRASWALGGLLASPSPGAKLLRRAIPAALLMLSFIGRLISKALLTESHFTWYEVTLLAMTCGAMLVGFIGWTALIVDRGESERKKLEEALGIDKEQIDRLLDRIEVPEAEVRLRRKVRVGFAFAIVLTSLLGCLSWRMARQAANDAGWVAHTQEVSTALEATLRHLVDVETGGRGFALTGSDPFLEPYETGRLAIVQDLRTLRLLMADNPGQERRLDTLAEEANSRIGVTSDLVALRRNLGKASIAELEDGKELMDAARATIADLEGEERRLLAQRTERTRAAQRFNLSVIALGALFGAIFLFVAGATVSREIGITARARAQINSLNANLERRVAERTAALGESERRLASVIQSAMDPIITVDEEHRVVLFNGAAERAFRCPAAEALGRPVNRFIPARFHDAHAEHIRRFGETNVTNRAMVPRGVLRAVRADGQEFQIESSISQAVTDGKRLFTVILRDVTEREQAAEARERLAAIVESSEDAIISKTLDGTITAWNHGAEKIFGYASSEAVGKSMRMLLPPERVDEETDILERIGRGLSVEHFETFRMRKDGRKIDVSVTISPIRDKNGVVIGASKIAHDISERKRAEKALREQAQVMELAQVFVRDAESRVVYWPRGAEKLYGFSSQEALGINSHDLFHTRFPEPLETIEKKLFETGLWEGELIHRRRDGSTIVVSSAWVLHRDSQGLPTRILETNIDITARKQAAEKLAIQAEELARSREALEAQTVMFKLVLDNMGEGLVAADQDGHFLIWNDAAQNLMGRGADNMPTERWTPHYKVFLPDGLTPYPPDRLPLVRALHGESVQVELVVQPPDNVLGRFLEVAARPLRDARGSLCGGVAVLRDVTKSKADEREIRQLNDELEIRVLERTAQLETANQELEAFSYSVSHDLRAPLRHISGFSQLLMEEFGATLVPEAQRYVERIQSGTQKMGLLVDELLNLARVGRHALNLRATSLNDLVAEVMTILQPESEGRQVEWKISDLPSLHCDPILIKQVLQNLLANALKFTRHRAPARIEVACRKNDDDGQPVLMVRDNGTGFDMKYVDKLFGVFQRLHRADEFEGTGIGLATVQRIVHKHEGRVWAEAEVDNGATFYFTLGTEKQTAPKRKGTTAGGLS